MQNQNRNTAALPATVAIVTEIAIATEQSRVKYQRKEGGTSMQNSRFQEFVFAASNTPKGSIFWLG